MATFKIGKLVLRSLFKKPATLMYPVVPRTWQERTRGQIGIDVDNCIMCGICAKKCPPLAIEVDRNKKVWTIHRMQCIQCGCCVEVCPKNCLMMEQAYTAPDTQKTVDKFTKVEAPKVAPIPKAAEGSVSEAQAAE